jgi:hypothetical protein
MHGDRLADQNQHAMTKKKLTDQQERNAAIRKWGNRNMSLISSRSLGLGIKYHTGQFYNTFKVKYYQADQKVYGIGYRMPRHAIFVHKGVGRGWPIDVAGSSVTRSKAAASLRNRGYNKTAIISTLAKTLSGKQGGKKRRPKPFFNPIIDRALPELADTVAKHDADLVAKNIFII